QTQPVNRRNPRVRNRKRAGSCRADSDRGSAPHPAGASPLRPGKNQNKTFLRRKNKKIPAPSRWSGRSTVGQKKNEEKLARDALGAVKQFHVLGSASLAGFEVIIGGRFEVITEDTTPETIYSIPLTN